MDPQPINKFQYNPFSDISQPCLTDVSMEPNADFANPDASAVRKPWMKRPGDPIIKVAPDVKRRRRNYQAKKLVTPKNPLMVLNELKPGLIFTFVEKADEHNKTMFVCNVELDEKTFTGQGLNKKQAQQEAAEAALKGLFFDKLVEQLRKREEADVEMKSVREEENKDDETSKSQLLEDDTPWSGLASFAMYKLVMAWHSSETNNHALTPSTKLPTVSQNIPQTSPTLLSFPSVAAKIPPNSRDIDPVMLLNQISPQSKFSELERDVRDGATVFTLTVDFMGNSYVGSATKKKTAKKLCAKNALKCIGVEYDD